MTNFLHVKNRARTTLASGVLIDDGLLTVLDGDVFPASGDFHVTINDEILNVTSRSGSTMSVQRAQEDTSASAHTISGYVELRYTAGVITEIQNEINAHEIDISTHGATDIADVSDIAVEANLSTNTQDAISKRHTRQHSITATDDHTSTATSGKLLKADASGLPVDATNTDIQVSGAVVKSHTQNTDTDLDATFELTFEKVVNKNTTSGYVGLDGSALIPLAQIPTTLTGKDADTLDTYHAVSFEKVANKAAISGYCDLDGSTLVPLSRIPSTLTGKDADTLDSQHRIININVDHTHQTTGAQAGQLDHGLALTGLSDDDHTQYALKTTISGYFTDFILGSRGATVYVYASDALNKPAATVAGLYYLCDGTADDVQIQAAIDILPATGGKVILSDGTFDITVTINLDTNQTLEGCGNNTILLTATASLVFLSAVGGAGTEKTGIIISDMQIDGASVSDTGIFFNYVDKSTIKNVYSRRHTAGTNRTGIYLINSDDNLIQNNVCQANNYRGICIYTDCNRNVVTGNICSDNGGAGISTYSSYSGTISGNICTSNQDGIRINSSSYWSVLNNTCISNTEDGIHSNISSYCIFVGNNLRANSANGIELFSGGHNTISDNTCIGNSQDTDNEDSNIKLSQSDYNLITGNLCRDGAGAKQTKYGITVLDSTCDNNTIEGNDLYDSGKTDDLNDAGTLTRVRNNIALDGTWMPEAFSDNVLGSRGATIYVYASDALNKPTATVSGLYYVCDGTADDVQIQLSITAVNAAGGGKIILSDGDFSTTAAIDHGYSNLVIEGQGIGITVIKPAGNINAFANVATGVHYVTLKGFTIDGTSQTGTTKAAIYSDRIYEPTIEDVRICNVVEDGILVYASGCDFNRVTIDTAGKNGIRVSTLGTTNPVSIKIRNCTITNLANTATGANAAIMIYSDLALNQIGFLEIDSCFITNISNMYAGIYIWGFNGAQGIISNTYLNNIDDMGIELQNTSGSNNHGDFTIRDTTVRRSRGAGFDISSSQFVKILNCTGVESMDLVPADGWGQSSGLDIVNSRYITVIGGRFSHRGGAGIHLYNPDDVTINGVQCFNNGNPSGSTEDGFQRDVGILVRAVSGTHGNVIVSNCQLYDTQATVTDALTAQANSGQKLVAVTTGTLFFPMQQVVLLKGGTTEKAKIEYVDGNTIHLRNNLTNTYATPATIQGIATQDYGVRDWENGGDVDYVSVLGNMISGNVVDKVLFAGTNIIIKDNPGYHGEQDVDDTAVNGATTAPISSNWAFDHDAATTGVHGVGAGTVAKTSDIPSFAVPAIVLGSVAASGVAATVIRSDSTIVAFDVTDPSTQAFGDSAVVGVATVAARRDHKHVIPANPVTAHVADSDPHTGYVKKYNFVTKIAAYNAVANDFIVVNTVSGVFNITLPIIQTAGISVYVKQLVDYENAVTILPSGLVTIDGGSSFAFERGGYEFISDGTNWLVI